MQPTSDTSSFKQILFLSLWLMAMGAGFYKLYLYSTTPGTVGSVQALWPQNSGIERNTQKALLVVFLHPDCECSRATLAELQMIRPQVEEKINFVFVFFKNTQSNLSSDVSELWKTATQFQFARSLVDQDGKIASEFGAETSGQTFLYDQKGHLVFQGGVTGMRGHVGDNIGKDAILSFAHTGTPLTSHTPAFGCSIRKGAMVMMHSLARSMVEPSAGSMVEPPARSGGLE